MHENANISRRTLIQGGALAGVVALAGGIGAATLEPPLAQAQPAKEPGKAFSGEGVAKQYGFFIHADKCTGCGQCAIACRKANNTPEDVPSRRKVEACTKQDGSTVHISYGCMHCEHPACIEVCPAGAISKGEGGVVQVNHNLCIGCKYCYQACPYGVPHYIEGTGMDKCDCCLEAGVELGKKPNCVKACKFRALTYGPVDEMLELHGSAAHQVEGPTGPSYYLI